MLAALSGRAPQSVVMLDEASREAMSAPCSRSSTPNAIAVAAHAVTFAFTVPSSSSAKAYCLSDGIHSFASMVATALARIARACVAVAGSPMLSAMRATRSSAATHTPLM